MVLQNRTSSCRLTDCLAGPKMEIQGGQAVVPVMESQRNLQWKETRLVQGYQTCPVELVELAVETVQESCYQERSQEATLKVEVQTETGQMGVLQTY